MIEKEMKILRKIYVKLLCCIGMAIDIGSKGSYPAGELSNFTPYPFTFRGFQCASMEGLLQGLKFEGAEKQAKIFKMVGKQAKFKGKKRKWYLDQKLYWQGSPMDRQSEEYKSIIDEAFRALATNTEFQKHFWPLATKNFITPWEKKTQRKQY